MVNKVFKRSILIAILTFIIFKSSDEPLLRILYGTPLESYLMQFPYGNSLLFIFASGLAISWIFYYITAYIPKKQKIDSLKSTLIESFNRLKERILDNLLSALRSNGGVNYQELRELLDPAECLRYFNKPAQDETRKFKYAINSLDIYQRKEIIQELEVFNQELLSLLHSIEVSDKAALRSLQIIHADIYRLGHDWLFDREALDYKRWNWVLWPLLTNEDIVGKNFDIKETISNV